MIPLPDGNPGILSIKTGELQGFRDFLVSSAPATGKIHPEAEVFPGRKSLISCIPGLPAGNGDHSLTFLTVYSL